MYPELLVGYSLKTSFNKYNKLIAFVYNKICF